MKDRRFHQKLKGMVGFRKHNVCAAAVIRAVEVFYGKNQAINGMVEQRLGFASHV
jgi:hypothetical protein